MDRSYDHQSYLTLSSCADRTRAHFNHKSIEQNMSSLLQLPGDIWRDIIVSFLGSVKEIVHLDLSLLSTNEKGHVPEMFP